MTLASILSLEKQFDLNPQMSPEPLIEAEGLPQDRFAFLFSQSTTKISEGFPAQPKQLVSGQIAAAA